jgi:hypothetical protein
MDSTKMRSKITPEAVALFRRALELQAAGRRGSDECADLETELDMALGRMKPWQISPLDADPDDPQNFEQDWQRQEREDALAIRKELLQLIASEENNK